MTRHIRKVAVIGSGVMGSGIAAHLANVGIPSLLLDIVPKEVTAAEKAKGLTLEDKAVRNRLSSVALQKLGKQKPAPLSSKEKLSYIEAGNLEDDLHRLQEVDWIIEVIVENLNIKQQLLKVIDEVRKPGTIVSSNTSGISIEAMSQGLSDDFQGHFLGTHFFNPPRYLKLLEVIPTAKTKEDVTTFMKAFAEETLGKGVVIGKDTPNFIANRIGTYGLLVTVDEMIKGGYSVGEVDSVTGPLIGRPKSATFRTLDVVGLDTFLHVAKNVHDIASGSEKEMFDPPAFMKEMGEKGWLGSKSGQGFYLKQGKEILEIEPSTLEYNERKKLKAPSIERAKQAKKLTDKIDILTYSDDRAGQLIWNIVKPVLLYSADKVYEIANDIYAVDQAMKWGFGWELGPFEMWDAIGVAKSVERMEAEGETIPTWVKDMLATGQESFYADNCFYHDGKQEPKPVNEKIIHLSSLKPDHVIFKNSGASLLDIGDDVALLEFHSPNNSIGADVIQMINKSIKEVEQNYKGLVINNQGKNFCVGANLMMILMEAQDDNFFEIDLVVRQFQQAMATIRYSEKPVVTAPFGMTLGGGTEICLPSASIQASLETYMGLVEVGVGLIPGGGGNKELYLRNLENSDGKDLQSVAIKTFETIAMAKVSTSAHEAVNHGFLGAHDGVVINGDLLIDRAKREVLHLDAKGYRPPERAKIPVVGESGYATMLLGAKTMKFGGMISDHDLKIAQKLAFTLSGGRVPKGTLVDEQYLLDLEREAFLSLVAEPKSQQRMQHMLTKGKPLRN
ncbi:3-hydroxyacyl-CoA dehydrogenase/enoyl-CoA hydratase family protein [Alkalihalobacillus sp. MEB130]|uniref:3-hydroxyacyl-CoA dehydrogenase/enoyl-CoA hydratase family protein n=1 Tax=Alkalihalobacillus sp. MEB130 TaxID=2976704 RepID=UPI0028DE0C43|nr:3-hydroxyacyl-CoA dehydrogenase NAD-binding domain-containing protein [Alkalihalobacillus sp. MEB130]MDT8858697.1 3-hydroxyacyl-CoA dehydrogenase/enoyl-CoA hydratase family protein [Alkalihalobacillus sp. MEB130]